MPDDYEPHEQELAYHQAGHAVIAYEQFGSDATASLTLSPNEDYLGAHTRTIALTAMYEMLCTFTDGGIATLIRQAEADGDSYYADWNNDQIETESERLDHQCDLIIDTCIAGYVATEIFCGIPNIDWINDDWGLATVYAERMGRDTEAMPFFGTPDFHPYFTSRWVIVNEILDGKYRQAIEALAARLMVHKTIPGDQVSQIITRNL